MADRKETVSGSVKGARNTTLAQGIFSLSKSAIGAGALALPGCFAKLGTLFGILVLAFASLTATTTLHFLSRLAANTDLNSYFALGNLAFGTAGQLSAMIALILFILGALIFYIVLAAGYVVGFLSYCVKPEVIQAQPWYLNNSLMMLFMVLLMFPIACMRDMSALGKASIVGMICMFYVLGLTVIDYFIDSAQRTVAPAIVGFGVETFAGVFSSLLFAFVNHFTMVSVVPALIDPSSARRTKLTTVSSSLVFLFYLVIGLFGYLHFGTTTTDNILAHGTTLAYAIARLMMAIMLILTYPLLLDPCRGTIEGALALISPSFKKPSMIRSVIITAAIMTISGLIGYFKPSEAGKILGCTVAFSGSLMVFVFPSAYFLKLGDRYKVHNIERIAAFGLIVFGIVFMGVGTFFNIKGIISSPK